MYVRELGHALHAAAPERIVFMGVRRDGPLADLALGAPARTWFPGGHHHTWLQRRADRDARAAGARLVHYTNAAAALRSTLPYVLTIHELSVMRHPGLHPMLRIATVPLTVMAARHARLIIVPSEATRREVRRLLHVPPERLIVISEAPGGSPGGPPPAAMPPDSPAMPLGSPAAMSPEAYREALLRRLGLEEGRYILSTGTLEPRKNHLRLVRAFERLAGSHPDLKLVLVGGRGWRDRAVLDGVADSPLARRIVMQGYVEGKDLHALFQGCGTLAYLSLYEGFGLPIVEGMAAGAPVVTSSVSSMPEVAGGAAILVDPRDEGAIARALLSAIDRRQELADRGRRRVQDLSWERAAAETLEVYDRALDLGG
ncbi:hypothetical protein BH20CHL6_BH20CHL6_04640 [soil metagenome]